MKTSKFLKIQPIQRLLALFLAVILIVYAAPVSAQSDELTLLVHRDFGFNSGELMSGTFTMSVVGPEDLQSVTFYMDGQPLAEDTTAPFEFQFKTRDYDFGYHELSASATTSSGNQLTSNVRTYKFATSEEELGGVQRIILPVLGLVFGLVAVMMLAQMVIFRTSKRNPLPLGEERNYGIQGGAICPKCNRPFPIHWWALNLLPMQKLEFCPHCGKIVVVRRVSGDKLRQAEKAELEWDKAQLPVAPAKEEDKLREQIDESRYMDS